MGHCSFISQSAVARRPVTMVISLGSNMCIMRQMPPVLVPYALVYVCRPAALILLQTLSEYKRHRAGTMGKLSLITQLLSHFCNI